MCLYESFVAFLVSFIHVLALLTSVGGIVVSQLKTQLRKRIRCYREAKYCSALKQAVELKYLVTDTLGSSSPRTVLKFLKQVLIKPAQSFTGVESTS